MENLTEQQKRDLYLRKAALGEIEGWQPSGYPSQDKPWLKYYSEEAVKAPLPEETVYEYLWESNKDHLENVAINYFNRKITYRELFENIEKTVKAYRAIGVKKGDIVVMITVTTPETIYSLYALSRMGAIPNMVDPRTSVNGIKDYILEADARFVLILNVVYEKVMQIIKDTSVKKIIVVSPADSLPPVKKRLFQMMNYKRRNVYVDVCVAWKVFWRTGKGQAFQDAEYIKGQCCLMVHTGGTTGAPKCVMLSNDNLNALVRQSIDTGIDMKREHTWLDIMPPFIAYGFGMGLHLPLVIGMTVYLIPQFDPQKFDVLLKKYKPVHMIGVPSYWNTILQSKRLKNADLSYMIAPTIGGDSMLPDLEKAVNCFLKEHNCNYKITKGYGMTEVCAGVSGTVDKNNEIGSVGIPFSKTVISIFDLETGNELPYNQVGEVCIAGPNIMIGYYRNENATKEIIREHKDGIAWIHSGDLGYMDENGSLFIVGRVKRMIIRYDGFKVFPSHIEKVVSKLQEIESCCAVGVKDSLYSHGMLPLVYTVVKKPYKGQEKEIYQQIMKLCGGELPEYAQPIDIQFVDELPLTPIGKVDYRALEKMAEESRG